MSEEKSVYTAGYNQFDRAEPPTWIIYVNVDALAVDIDELLNFEFSFIGEQEAVETRMKEIARDGWFARRAGCVHYYPPTSIKSVEADMIRRGIGGEDSVRR